MDRVLEGVGVPVGASAVEGVLVVEGADLVGALDELESEAEGSVPADL